MKRIIIGALLLSGCGQSDLKRAQQAVADRTREPGAAQFKNVTHCTEAPDMIVGKVNAKNTFGGYVGLKTFFVDRGVVTIADDEMARNPEGRRFIMDLVERCGRADV